MKADRSWAAYRSTYRAREIKIISGWIRSGESGSVVGLSGCGRANLLGFLCHRPDVVRSYLPPQFHSVALIPVDLNILPANNLATLYRLILRAFHRVYEQFDLPLQQQVVHLYETTRAERDPFLVQSALQELLWLCQKQQTRIVLVINRFDRFFEMATPHMVNTLRALRDDFKMILSYVVGLPQEVAYLPDPAAVGDMYELLDNYICWVGAMNEADSRQMIDEELQLSSQSPTETDLQTILELTGGYPALVKAACSWWLTVEEKPDYGQWSTTLLTQRSIQYRLARVWTGLTQEEQYIVSELQRLQPSGSSSLDRDRISFKSNLDDFEQARRDFGRQYGDRLTQLEAKGICCHAETGWRIAAGLLAQYLANLKKRGRGRIWQHETTGEIYQGQTLVEGLTNLERAVLCFLIDNPYSRHTKTDLIINTWPDELRKQGVTDNSLYQVIFSLRQVVEPAPGKPAYLVTWRGKPEGGYQFFSEGRPS